MTLKSFFNPHRPLDPAATSPYTDGLVTLLDQQFGIRPGQRGAEICSQSGSNTQCGRLTALFLDHGYRLTTVEPDLSRHVALDRLRTRWPQFSVVAGETTSASLPDASLDFILSERALYQPDPLAVRREFQRLLRPGGVALLVTDNRVYGGGAQSEAFEQILRTHCSSFREKAEPAGIRAAVTAFFGGQQPYEDAFIGHQELTLEAFLAQTSRLAIFPAAGDPAHQAIFLDLRRHFAQWAKRGVLRIPHVCRVACGPLTVAERKTPSTHATLAAQ